MMFMIKRTDPLRRKSEHEHYGWQQLTTNPTRVLC